MTEPFMMAPPGDGYWHMQGQARFKSPERQIVLVPMTSGIMAGDRPMYSVEECQADDTIWKNAVDNTAHIGLRVSVENDLVSVRSSKSAGTPGTAALLLPGPKRRARILQSLTDNLRGKKMPPAQDHYFIFITPDEALMADKAKFTPSVLRKMVRNIKNQLESSNPGLLLATEVMEYDPDEDCFQEV